MPSTFKKQENKKSQNIVVLVLEPQNDSFSNI